MPESEIDYNKEVDLLRSKKLCGRVPRRVSFAVNTTEL